MPLCSITSKVFLVFIGIILWAAAAGLIFIGAWVYKEYQHYDQIADATYTLIPATILMASGVFFFLLGIIGCAGALKEQRCLLGVFFSVLLVLLLGMVVSAVLGYVYRTEVKQGLQDGIEKGLTDEYGNDTVWTKQIDFMQEELHCCGSNNYTDWANTAWGENWIQQHKNTSYLPIPYPESCCRNQSCDYTIPPTDNSTSLYIHGCYNKLQTEFSRHLGILGAVAGTFAALLILGMGCSCILICRRKQEHQYVGLTSPEHMRV